jgi:hypothetical protein
MTYRLADEMIDEFVVKLRVHIKTMISHQILYCKTLKEKGDWNQKNILLQLNNPENAHKFSFSIRLIQKHPELFFESPKDSEDIAMLVLNLTSSKEVRKKLWSTFNYLSTKIKFPDDWK